MATSETAATGSTRSNFQKKFEVIGTAIVIVAVLAWQGPSLFNSFTKTNDGTDEAIEAAVNMFHDKTGLFKDQAIFKVVKNNNRGAIVQAEIKYLPDRGMGATPASPHLWALYGVHWTQDRPELHIYEATTSKFFAEQKPRSEDIQEFGHQLGFLN